MRLTLRLCEKAFDSIGNLTKKYANLPDRYLKRVVNEVEWKTPDGPNYLPREVRKYKGFKFTTNRPWTAEAQRRNEQSIGDKVFLEPIKDWTVFKGDRVEVLVGKDKGKIGIVSQVIQERNWVVVGGLNWVRKRVGQRAGFEGMVIRWELPLLVTSQVALVDPADDKQTKVEWRYTEDGERVRVSLRTGRIIPMPAAAEETYDYKTAATYLESEAKDTKAADVELITFEPKLKTFEMEIMEAMGIKETRVPKKSYWY